MRCFKKPPLRSCRAFSLLEVMIAMAMFFVVLFTILDLTSQSISAARRLQQPSVDVGLLANQLVLTNNVEQGFDSGEFEAEVYRDYEWEREIYEVSTNGLLQADFWVYKRNESRSQQPTLSILLYRPQAATSAGEMP